MQLDAFIATHAPALESDEVRHNLILGVLARAAHGVIPQLSMWSLGAPGACAIRTPGRHIILGELQRSECHAFAEAVRDLAYSGVVGPGSTASWFAERAAEFGAAFADPIPERIYALHSTPTHPGCPGYSRRVEASDATLLADWLIAFSAEAVPDDPVPTRAELERVAGEGRHMFWVVEGEPVSMAGIVRRTRNTAAIAAVFTPPSHRGRGYAGAVTAEIARRIFAEGKTTACLYTDLRNPASNRCYARIGFEPVCDAWVYPRRRPQD